MTWTMVFLIVSMALLIAFVHPYVIYPLSLRVFRPVPINKVAGSSVPTFSMMFAAFNEENSLPSKLENIRAIRDLHPSAEVLAYSDMSTDKTLSLLTEAKDILDVFAAKQRTGKATGMRLMVEQAIGEVCIFTDANVVVDPLSIGRLLAYFSDESVGAVAGSLIYVNEKDGPTARVGGLYWRMEENIKSLESRCGSTMGADGSIFAIRRSLYPEVPPHLLDDMIASISVLRHKKRLIHASDVLAFERSATQSKDEFRRKRRIACRAYNTHLFLYPELKKHLTPVDKYKYVSHKFLRWFGITFLIGSALSLAAALLLSFHSYILLMLICLALVGLVLGRAGFPLLSPGLEIIKAIFATFLGVVDAWRGRTYQTWAPVASR